MNESLLRDSSTPCTHLPALNLMSAFRIASRTEVLTLQTRNASCPSTSPKTDGNVAVSVAQLAASTETVCIWCVSDSSVKTRTLFALSFWARLAAKPRRSDSFCSRFLRSRNTRLCAMIELAVHISIPTSRIQFPMRPYLSPRRASILSNGMEVRMEAHAASMNRNGIRSLARFPARGLRAARSAGNESKSLASRRLYLKRKETHQLYD